MEKTFVPGKHDGEVHVYDLDTGKYLGGFRFSETNKDTVTADKDSYGYEMDAEISNKVEAAIESGLTKFASLAPG